MYSVGNLWISVAFRCQLEKVQCRCHVRYTHKKINMKVNMRKTEHFKRLNIFMPSKVRQNIFWKFEDWGSNIHIQDLKLHSCVWYSRIAVILMDFVTQSTVLEVRILWLCVKSINHSYPLRFFPPANVVRREVMFSQVCFCSGEGYPSLWSQVHSRGRRYPVSGSRSLLGERVTQSLVSGPFQGRGTPVLGSRPLPE